MTKSSIKFNRVLNTPLMIIVAGYGDNLSNKTAILLNILTKKDSQYYFLTIMVVPTIRMMAWMRKMYSCSKNQLEKTTIVEWNKGMNILTRHNPFYIDTPLYFHVFWSSSIVIHQVFCSSIYWRIQSPVKFLRWGVLRKWLWEKNSSTFETLRFFDDFKGWWRVGGVEVNNFPKIVMGKRL